MTKENETKQVEPENVEESDAFIEETLENLHHAICDFLGFGTSIDLIEECLAHIRRHEEEDNEVPEDLKMN